MFQGLQQVEDLNGLGLCTNDVRTRPMTNSRDFRQFTNQGLSITNSFHHSSTPLTDPRKENRERYRTNSSQNSSLFSSISGAGEIKTEEINSYW